MGRKAVRSKCLNCENNAKTRVAIYCSNSCQQDYQINHKVLLGIATSRTLKQYLIRKDGHKCWKCKNSVWNNEPIPLELEHIDGNSDNNSLDNLEILCPNCHAQTPTYKNRNKGNGRHYRRERYAAGKSF